MVCVEEGGEEVGEEEEGVGEQLGQVGTVEHGVDTHLHSVDQQLPRGGDRGVQSHFAHFGQLSHRRHFFLAVLEGHHLVEQLDILGELGGRLPVGETEDKVAWGDFEVLAIGERDSKELGGG